MRLVPLRLTLQYERPSRVNEAATIESDEPITLKEACAVHYRNRIKVASLRAEAARGRLDIFRVGRTDFTTLKNIREMERRCRVEKQARASTLTGPESNGSSETERLSSAQAALSLTVERLKGSSQNTLAASTPRNRVRTRS